MEVGWKQIWLLYGWKELFSFRNKLFYFSLFVVFAFSILFLKFGNDSVTSYDLIVKIVGLGISILPTLLGFNLGAYALIIGFLTNQTLLSVLTKAKDGESANNLQRICSVFAVNIITQAFTLLCSFLFSVFIDLKISLPTNFIYYDEIISVINYFSLIFILFFTLYSVVLLIQNAINVFDFSQLFTHFATKEKKDDSEKPIE